MSYCQFCQVKIDRDDNLKRHEDEVHRKILKECKKCGKPYTAAALSRHKKSCDGVPSTSETNLVPNGLDPIIAATGVKQEDIASVTEHNINIKFITLTDGRVISLHNEIHFGGYTYFLDQRPSNGNYYY